MAVPVHQHFPLQLWWSISRGMILEKFAEKKCLAAEARGARILRKEIAQFIAKDTGTAGFQNDDRNSGVDLRLQGAQDSLEVPLGLVEHTEIVQRPAAAQVNLRDTDFEPGIPQYIERSLAGFGAKIIVEKGFVTVGNRADTVFLLRDVL